jgi:hypothetical protein
MAPDTAPLAPAIDSLLDGLGTAQWARLVEQAMGQPGWKPLTWNRERLYRTFGSTTVGVFRVGGTAQAAEAIRPWSLILKVISPAAWNAMTGGQPAELSHPLYWKREALAYESGWLDRLPGKVRGPRCLGIEEQPDGSVWLWLEKAQDNYHGHWPLEQYARAARCLGAFNGAYLTPEAWPPYPWLAQIGTPRGVIEAFSWIEPLVRDPATWDRPALRAAVPRRLAARLPEFWDHRHNLLAALDQLPQTLCHHDAWRGNMFCPPGALDELMLIDWAYTGRACLGADLADLAVAGYPLVPVESNHPPAEIDRAVFEPYLEGLCDAGWPAPRAKVRFAYCVCAALKYGCLLIWLRDIGTPEGDAFWERFGGQSLAAWLGQQVLVLEHQLNLLDEARRLLPAL